MATDLRLFMHLACRADSLARITPARVKAIMIASMNKTTTEFNQGKCSFATRAGIHCRQPYLVP